MRIALACLCALALTGCATIAPNLTVEQQRALLPEADRDSVGGAIRDGLSTGALSVPVAEPLASLTLTLTLPSRLPHFEGPGQRVACAGGGPASTDTLTGLRDLRAYAVPQIRCSPWAAGVPGWPECWHPSPPILLGIFDAVGQEGKRMTVEVAPLLGVGTYYVTTTRGRLYAESCESNMVTVER